MASLKKTALLTLAALPLLAAAVDYTAEGKLWWAHIQFLADDKLEGRNVGTPGFQQAGDYVSGEFKKFGLKPAGINGYLQPVKFDQKTLQQDQSSLALVRDGKEIPLALGADATLNARADLAPKLEAPMVFVGYGLSVPEAHWNDLEGMDLKGKIAVYVNATGPAEMSGNVRSHVGTAAERWKVLRAAGAVGVATIAAGGRGGGAAAPTQAPGRANILGDQPAEGSPATPAAPAAGRGAGGGGGGRGGAPQPTIDLADRTLLETAGMGVSLTVTARGADKIFEGSGHTYAEILALARDNKPLPRFPLTGTLRSTTSVKHESVDSFNVVGMVPGSGKLKNEYVILSAHLDHLGVGRAINGDNIYNGAMDDASGIATILEVSRILKESKFKLKRSVIFLAVTGEEKGELGSRYFAAHPTVPFKQIVADINLDMFLPLYPLKVIEVQGLMESTLGDTVKAAAAVDGVDVQVDQEPEQNRFIRSDQYSFIRAGVPSLAFKFGYIKGSPDETTRRNWVRDVYHKPNDDLKQPVDTAAAAKFDRIILRLMESVANDATRPSWKSDSFFKRFATAP